MPLEIDLIFKEIYLKGFTLDWIYEQNSNLQSLIFICDKFNNSVSRSTPSHLIYRTNQGRTGRYLSSHCM